MSTLPWKPNRLSLCLRGIAAGVALIVVPALVFVPIASLRQVTAFVPGVHQATAASSHREIFDRFSNREQPASNSAKSQTLGEQLITTTSTDSTSAAAQPVSNDALANAPKTSTSFEEVASSSDVPVFCEWIVHEFPTRASHIEVKTENLSETYRIKDATRALYDRHESLPLLRFDENSAPFTTTALRNNAPFGETLKELVKDVLSQNLAGNRLACPSRKYTDSYVWLSSLNLSSCANNSATAASWSCVFASGGCAEPDELNEIITDRVVVSSGKTSRRDRNNPFYYLARIRDKCMEGIWLAAALTTKITQPSETFEALLVERMKAIGWPTLGNSRVIGVHIRRGDACACDERRGKCYSVDKSRTCFNADAYTAAALRMVREMGAKHILVVSDGDLHRIVDRMKLLLKRDRLNVTVMYNSIRSSLWKVPQSSWIEHSMAKMTGVQRSAMSMESILELWMLTRCDFFIGAMSSAFYKIPFWSAFGRLGFVPPFHNMDCTWCWPKRLIRRKAKCAPHSMRNTSIINCIE